MRVHRSTLVAAIAMAVVVAVGLTTYAVTASRARISAADTAAIRPLEPVMTTPSPPTPALTDVARTALVSTVTVEVATASDEQFGTAWLYDTRGDFVTNAHVVTGYLSVRLRDRRGASHVGIVVGSDPTLDIAVIRSQDGFSAPPLPPSTKAASRGDGVVVLAAGRATGHGDVTEERVDATGRLVNSDGESGNVVVRSYPNMVALSGAPIYQGNSGGPVLDQGGRVVAVVTLTNHAQTEGYAIPIGSVLTTIQGYAAHA